MPDETIEQAEVVLDAASKNVVTLTNEREAKLTAAKKTRDDAQATAAGAYDATVEATRVEYKAKLADARKQETQAKNALSDLLGRSAQAAARARADTAFAASVAGAVSQKAGE